VLVRKEQGRLDWFGKKGKKLSVGLGYWAGLGVGELGL
jgi:hypothetical protein